MFLLKRVDGRTKAYRVHSCDSYRVEAPDDPRCREVVLFGRGYDDRICTLVIATGDVLYVMNESGKTIDTIDMRPCESSGSLTAALAHSSGGDL